MMTNQDVRVVAPQRSWAQLLVALVLLVVAGGLLYYSYLVWRALS